MGNKSVKIRSGPRQLLRLWLIDYCFNSVPKGAAVLDAGCGDGVTALHFARKGYQVCAVDADSQGCAILKKRAEKENISKQIKVIVGDVTRVGFGEHSFDAVVCGEVLEHVDDDEKFLSCLKRVLKPGGLLVLSVPLIGKGWDKWDRLTGHKRLYKLSSLYALLRKNGLRVGKCFSWGYPFMKWYHTHIFLKWANKVDAESEIRKETLFLTKLGKNNYVSFLLAMLFFVDLIFTPRTKGIGVVVRAHKE